MIDQSMSTVRPGEINWDSQYKLVFGLTFVEFTDDAMVSRKERIAYSMHNIMAIIVALVVDYGFGLVNSF